MSGTQNNAIYFTTGTGPGFGLPALWVTDGTPGGTRRVTDFAGATAALPVAEYGGAFVVASTGPGSTDLYATKGNAADTIDALPGLPVGPVPLVPGAGLLGFALLPPTALPGALPRIVGGASFLNSAFLTFSDGTNRGTQILQTFAPQTTTAPETIGGFTTVGTSVFFVEANANGSARLRSTKGVLGDVQLVATADAIAPLAAVSSASLGTRLLFATTSAGDTKLEVVAPGASAVVLEDLGGGTASVAAVAGGTAFIAVSGAANSSLLAYDGSNASPTTVATFAGAAPVQLVAASGAARVFFVQGGALWSATAGGAVRLATPFTSVANLFALGNALYFAGSTAEGAQLWSWDGSAAVATELTHANIAGGGIRPSAFSSLNGSLYFAADDGAGGTELWTSDGTASGTRVAVNIDPGGATLSIAGTAPGVAIPPSVLGQVADDLVGVTDGTAAGTVASRAGIVTIGNGFQPSGAPTLSVSHGTAATTVNVTVGPAPPSAGGSQLTVRQASDGAFYSFVEPSIDGTRNTAAVIGFIGETSVAPQTIRTFTPSTAGGSIAIEHTTAGARDYVAVSQEANGFDPSDTQLFVTDVATTTLVGDLGAVTVIDALADGSDWAAIVQTTSGVNELARSVAGAAPKVVTTTALGFANGSFIGYSDNTGDGLGVLGGSTLFSLVTGNTVDIVATDGTQAGTRVLLSQPQSGFAFSPFVRLGEKVLFLDQGNNLYVTDGTVAHTSQLLAGAVSLAPANGSTAPVTAQIVSNGVTYLYFTATTGGSTGLYRTDGNAVQTIQASGVSADLVAVNGKILYIASALGGDGTRFNTVFATDPATLAGAPVVDPAGYLTDGLLARLGPPVTTTLQPATLAPIGQSLALTTGTDAIAGGTGDDTVTATAGTLNAADKIDGGGGLNVLRLDGSGVFDLSAPVTLANIASVFVDGAGQTVTLRAGTSFNVTLASTSNGFGGTIFGADNADLIRSQSTAFYVVNVGGAHESVSNVGRVIESTANSAAAVNFVGVLELTGGGVATLGVADVAIGRIQLDAPTQLTVNGKPNFTGTAIVGSNGVDNVTVSSGPFFYQGKGGDDTLTFALGGSGELQGIAADIGGDAINGYDFVNATGGAALIDVTNFAFSAAETIGRAGDVLTLTAAAGSASFSIGGLSAALQADPFGAFLASSDGASGTLLTFFPSVVRLTTGTDTVTAPQNTIFLAGGGTLNPADQITGGGGSKLLLQGAGTFDLGAPSILNGISEVDGDTTTGAAAVAQTIKLRLGSLDPNNFYTTLTLGPGADTVIGVRGDNTRIGNPYGGAARVGGYAITLGDATESVTLPNGSASDVFVTDASTALASIDDQTAFGIPLGTERVTGTGIVGVGNAFVGTVALSAGQHAYLLGAIPGLVRGAGNDVIDAGFRDGGFSGATATIDPGGPGTVIGSEVQSIVLQGTAAELNGVTFEGFDFAPNPTLGGLQDTIVVTDFTNAASLTATLSGNVLTISDGAGPSVTVTLPGAPAGHFTASTNTTSGTTLSFQPTVAITPLNATYNGSGFAGTAGNDTLTVTAGQLAAGQTIDGGAGINTLILSGAGAFDLSAPTTLANFRVVDVAAGQTVTARAGLAVEYEGSGATILGAASADTIVLGGFAGSGDTLVLGSRDATVIVGAQGAGDTVVANAATIGATIYGGTIGGGTPGIAALQITGGGVVVMGANKYDIGSVALGLTGVDFQANDLPGLPIDISGTTGPGDTVRVGGGGDTVTDTSVGGNTLVAGAAGSVFSFGTQTVFAPEPAGDAIVHFDRSGHDSILVSNNSYAHVAYANHALTISNYADPQTNGYTAFTINLPDDYVAADFVGSQLVVNNVILGFQVTYTGSVTCFAAGTRIRTIRGEVAVERLLVGDRVVLASGGSRPVEWIGARSVDITRHPNPDSVRPVRIAAHAFGPGLPVRPLRLSPDHAVLWDGALIPVKHLLNGHTVRAETATRTVRYFHVELDGHDVLLADGLAVESYLETGQRDSFENGGTAILLHPEFCARERDARACRPFAVAGIEVDAARATLTQAASDRRSAAMAC